MVTAAAFVIGFVVIGLSVVLIAFRGGPRGAREAMHTQTARGRTTASLVIGLIGIAFGIGIPAAVLASSGQDRKASGGVKLTADEAKGRELFVHNCATCHTLAGAGSSGRVGPNLDQLRPPKALVLNAIQLGRARGAGQMPAGLLVGKDAQNVAAFVAATAGH
jgi:mono/diheme cytochrome c family protein